MGCKKRSLGNRISPEPRSRAEANRAFIIASAVSHNLAAESASAPHWASAHIVLTTEHLPLTPDAMATGPAGRQRRSAPDRPLV
ncbi:hypothetical protein AAFF_G00276730 [Aldrovandia affinis]|uniref:Uncharacterized protein n=1 Tax=Aldrovandia affinis TaxID=143900 RepID=A0AAD7RAI5_9TELE|nr:hypothetical protein AAFF_G00276730 [Aldrovandia affinis]